MNPPHARGNKLNQRDVELFNSTTVSSDAPAAAGSSIAFYQLFVASSAEVAVKFANTDFRVQKAALKVSWYMIMSSIERKPESNVHLERITARHSRSGLDIGPHLYDLWLDCLIRPCASAILCSARRPNGPGIGSCEWESSS
jgi:hypothetical protein